MPIYEYECKLCSFKWERYFKSGKAESTMTCPNCEGVGEMVYSVCKMRSFEPFWTSNIMEDGTPVLVKSESHLHQLETDHGVKCVGEDNLPILPPPVPKPIDD